MAGINDVQNEKSLSRAESVCVREREKQGEGEPRTEAIVWD